MSTSYSRFITLTSLSFLLAAPAYAADKNVFRVDEDTFALITSVPTGDHTEVCFRFFDESDTPSEKGDACYTTERTGLVGLFDSPNGVLPGPNGPLILDPPQEQVIVGFVDLPEGSDYYIRAFARGPGGESALSSDRYVVLRASPPAPPSVPLLIEAVREAQAALDRALAALVNAVNL